MNVCSSTLYRFGFYLIYYSHPYLELNTKIINKRKDNVSVFIEFVKKCSIFVLHLKAQINYE